MRSSGPVRFADGKADIKKGDFPTDCLRPEPVEGIGRDARDETRGPRTSGRSVVAAMMVSLAG